MKIREAAAEVLREMGRPMTAREVYTRIVERKLYEFGAQDPEHVVHSVLRRHCRDLNFPSARLKRFFALVEGDKFTLLPEPVKVEPNVYKVAGGKKPKIVTIPPEDDLRDEDGKSHSHTEIQWKLLELGSLLGMSVWAPIADRGRAWNGKRISSIKNLVGALPRQFDPGTMKTISYIDVIWLEKQAIAAAFEVEHTSSVASGLLRMADLMTMQPNLDIKWFIVAPATRFGKFAAEVGRPTFSALRKPLHQICRFLAYDKLTETLDAARKFLPHLKPAFLDDIAEKYDPAEGFEDDENNP